MDDLVSIIMPSYNTGKYIKKSIESVLSQTYNNWELIIVDDCSNDDTDNIVASFNDERIRFFKNSGNKGAAFSRNIALRLAKGEYIAFLDSDDLWHRDKLKKQILFMKTNNYYFSYTCYEKINEEGNNVGVLCTGPKIITKRKMFRYCYPGCLTVMFKNDKHIELQIENIKKNNDYAMWLKLCKLYNCYLLDENLAKYRIRTQSISHDKLYKKIKSHFLLFRFCEHRSVFISLIFAIRNLFFGLIKKIKYERKV